MVTRPDRPRGFSYAISPPTTGGIKDEVVPRPWIDSRRVSAVPVRAFRLTCCHNLQTLNLRWFAMVLPSHQTENTVPLGQIGPVIQPMAGRGTNPITDADKREYAMRPDQ